jgi:hypothetical protein
MNQLKSLCLFFFACLFTLNLFGQAEDNELVRQVNISILYPGFSAEAPLNEKISIFGKFGLGLELSATNFPDGEYTIDYTIAPAYNIQGRFYYKGSKSETRSGKLLFSNSGNYAFVQLAGNLPPLAASYLIRNEDGVYNLGLGWGFQRVYKSNFLISWGIGVGYYTTQNINLISELTLGISLYKK